VPPQRPYSLKGMARTLGMSRDWVIRHIDERFTADAFGNYSPECLKDLELKSRQLKQLRPLGNRLTLWAAAEKLAVTRPVLQKLIEQHNLPKLVVCRNSSNIVVQAVPHKTMRELKSLVTPIAPITMANLSELSAETGWAKDTIKRHLEAAIEVPRGQYRSPRRGMTITYYDRMAALAVIGVKSVPAGGDYFTATTIAALLGRKWDWVRERLNCPFATSTAELRLDDFGRIRAEFISSSSANPTLSGATWLLPASMAGPYMGRLLILPF
jgi:hypothetical protein